MNFGHLVNRDAEKALICALLVNPSVVEDVDELYGGDLSDGDFYYDDLRKIYKAIRELASKGADTFDPFLISAKAGVPDSLITEILAMGTPSVNAPEHAKMVHDLSLRRKIVVRASSFASEAYDIRKDVSEIAAKMGVVGAGKVNAVTALDAISATLRFEKNGKALPFHDEEEDVFSDLSFALGGGAHPSATHVFAATPQTGKTIFALFLAGLWSKKGKSVLYVTTEMSAENMMRRLILSGSSVSYSKYSLGEIGEQEIQAMIAASENLGERYKNVVFLETRNSSAVEAWVASNTPDVLIVDTLTAMDYSKSDGRVVGTGDNMSKLSSIALRYKIPVIVMHHIAVTVTGKPGLKDLVWARGDIASIADVVVCMWRNDLDEERNGGGVSPSLLKARELLPVPVNLTVAKNRFGISGVDITGSVGIELKAQRFVRVTERVLRM